MGWRIASRLLGATMFLIMGAGCAWGTYNVGLVTGLEGPAPMFFAMMICLTLACGGGAVQTLRGEWD